MDNLPRNSSPVLLIFSLIIHSISAATDTIDTSGSIRDGETMVSSGGIFELGFFNPGNSTNQYVGIWYKNTAVRTYVWVANRQTPLTAKSGVLRVTRPGILALFNDTNGVVVWSSNASISTSVANPVARILDSGNLVVHESSVIVWQSFDHPTDTYLPGMMSFGWNLATGVETSLSSWKSNDDPAPGDYAFHLDPTGYPELKLKLRGTTVYRVGPWNGIRLSGTPAQSSVIQILVMNKGEVRYGEDVVDRSVLSMTTLTPDGIAVRQSLSSRTKSWTTLRDIPLDRCDDYGLCGAYGVCNAGISPPCGCLDRFMPKAPMEWNEAYWSSGCVRRIQLNCRGDVFLTYSGIKLPDAVNTSIDQGTRSLEECEIECSRKCTCVAYTRLNISEGSGCLFYHGELIDIRILASGGQDLYIRMASAERDHVGSSKGKNRIIVIIVTVVGALILCLGLILIHGRIRKRKGKRNVEEFDLPFFSLSTIMQATDNFSTSNKLGEGGFGPVYKGTLEDGREIAVKRLSKSSSQGAEQLKNEVILIAKLQHRNLVRVLGSCIQGEENMLV